MAMLAETADGTTLASRPGHSRRPRSPVIVRLSGSRVVSSLLALLVYLAASVWLWQAVAFQLTTRANPGGSHDAALIMWWLRWVPFALAHGHDPFYTHYLNAPGGASAMWNTSLLTLGALFAPVTLLFNVTVTFNILCILAPALSAWTCSLWLRRHARALPAFLGGLIFGFSPFVVLQGEFAHLMMTWLVLVPIIAMLVENILYRSARPWWPWGPLLGLVVVLQLLTSSEVLVMTVVAVILAVMVLAVTYRRAVAGRIRPAATGFLAALGVAGVLGAWPLYEQFASGHAVHGPVQGIDYWEGMPIDLVSAPRSVLLHTAHSAAVAGRFPSHENGLYIGVPLLVAIGAFLVFFGWKRKAILVGTVVAAVLFVFSLGGQLRRFPRLQHYGPLLPWGYLERHLSLLENVIPVRFAAIIWLAVSLIVAVGLDELVARRTSWVGTAAVVAVIASLIPLVPTTEGSVGKVISTPKFFTTTDIRLIPRNSVALVVPMPDSTDPAAMFWQVQSGMWFSQPGGYVLHASGPHQTADFYGWPPTLVTDLSELSERAGVTVFHGSLTPIQRQVAQLELAATGARSVVVDAGSRFAAQFVVTLRAILGRPPDAQIGGVYLWHLSTR